MHVLIVDDHPIVCRGLAQTLLNRPAIESCDEAHSVAAGLLRHSQRRPDAIVLDLSLGDESGLDLLRALRSASEPTPVLVLSMFDEAIHAERALQAGAQGYLMKATPPEQVADGVERVARGEQVLSERLRAHLDDSRRAPAPQGVDALTEREKEVLRLLGAGHTTAEIASIQFRSVKTIDSHRESIKRKLGLRSATELVRYATLWRERAL